MDQMQGRAEAGAKRGYLTASIDCRYHGRRCPPGEDKRDCYEHALVRSALSFDPGIHPTSSHRFEMYVMSARSARGMPAHMFCLLSSMPFVTSSHAFRRQSLLDWDVGKPPLCLLHQQGGAL